MRTNLLPIVAACLLLLLPSCLFGSESNSKQSGNFVSADTLNKVEVGAEREYVKSLLGSPTTEVNLADGSQVWKWEYSVVTTSKGWAFLIFSNKSKDTKEGTVYVELDPDGMVTKTWRD